MPDRRKVAVLGAGGFIGGRLVESLVLGQNVSVVPIVRSYHGSARLARFALEPRLADATDRASLETQFQGCEIVFHCVVGDRSTILASLEAAYRAASAAGVRRLVYISSAVVHGHDPSPGTNEGTPLLRRQPFEYNVSKVLAEERLQELRQDGKVETVVLRPCIVWGPRSMYWTAQIAQDLLAHRAYLVDGGQGICNTIHVDNLVHAMWLAATSEMAANQTLLLTDGERVTWADLYRSVASAVGVDTQTIWTVSASDVQRRSVAESWSGRLLALGGSRFGNAIRRSTPRRARHALFLLVNGVPAPPAGAGTPQPPVPDAEIVSLQQCRYALPIDRAKSVLGYEPVVTFEEGARRSAAWIRFAFGASRDLRDHASP